MPAFTRLCKNVNISVAHNTVTLYIPPNLPWVPLYKKIAESKVYNPWDPMIKQIWAFDLYDACNPNDPFVKKLSPVKPVYRNSLDHDYFHDDTFDRDIDHFHMQFTKNIDEANFEIFLSILVEKKIIDLQEKEGCLIAFRQATQDVLGKFYDELATIQLKALELNEKAEKDPKNYQEAATVANELYETVKREAKVYLKDKKADTYNAFRIRCKEAIDKAKPVLEKHRGWKEVLINLGAAILGLGIFYLIALGINYHSTHRAHLFFHCETDSAKKLKQFEDAQAAILRV